MCLLGSGKGEFAGTATLACLLWGDELILVAFSFDSTIDPQVNWDQHPLRGILVEDLHPIQSVGVVVEQLDVFTNQLGWGLINSPVQRDGAILGYPSSRHFTEVVFKIYRR